jgi:tRNA threonylcarbamoyladenosine biosynthesis protein TsaE
LGTIVIDVPTPERMRDLGRALGRVAQAGDSFMLEGPFGAGKTTFVQGLAQGLDVASPVSSPSFVIENRYRGRLPLYHVDLFRLDRIEPELLGSLEEDLYGDGVAAVEWAERLPPGVRDGIASLRFSTIPDGRRIEVSTEAERFLTALRAA